MNEIIEKVSNNKPSVEECAKKNVLSCERDLGIFYSYNVIGENNKIISRKDTKNAEKWFYKSIRDPVSQFGLGKIQIEKKNTPSYNLFLGEKLIYNSCASGIEDACHYLLSIYDNKFQKILTCENRGCDKILEVISNLLKIIKKDSDLSDSEKEKYTGEYNIKLAEVLIRRNNPEAVKILEDAVAHNVTWSTATLAPLYAKGELIPKDLVRAYMLYDLSGTGYADDKAKVAEEMTPAQIQQAKEMSWRWQDEHRSYRPGYRDSDMGVQWQGVNYH